MTSTKTPSLRNNKVTAMFDDDDEEEEEETFVKIHQRTLSEASTTTKATSISSTASVTSETSSQEQEEEQDVLSTVDLFPYNTSIVDLKQLGYTNIKKVHWIRHAQGYHNVDNGKNSKSKCCIDARLTPKGIDQCRNLAQAIESAEPGTPLHDVRQQTQLVVTSPVTRCVQTTLHSLRPLLKGNGNGHVPPVVANDSIRETVNFNCDRRRPIHEIVQDFPQVDFTQACPYDEDNIWETYVQQLGDDTAYTQERESAEIYKIADRCRVFFTTWLRHRPEAHVCVCAHATVSRCIFNFGLSSQRGRGTPTDVPQVLDTRVSADCQDVPVVNYGHNDDLDAYVRKDFENCELRSMIVAYKWKARRDKSFVIYFIIKKSSPFVVPSQPSFNKKFSTRASKKS